MALERREFVEKTRRTGGQMRQNVCIWEPKEALGYQTRKPSNKTGPTAGISKKNANGVEKEEQKAEKRLAGRGLVKRTAKKQKRHRR